MTAVLPSTALMPPTALAGLSGLRAWAAGCRSDEAAVELLAGIFSDGWCVSTVRSWVRPCARSGWYWLDGPGLWVGLVALPVKDQPVAGLAASLCGSGPMPDLGTLLAAVPARQRAKVAAALTYALGGPATSLAVAA